MKPIESLYNTLVQDGYDVGDLNTFSTKLQDSNKAKALYDAISTDGYDVGDFDSFYSKLKPTVQFDDYSKQLGAAPAQPKVNTSMYVTPELEAQAKQQAVPQNVQPLSPEEANSVIYGGIPGTTKIGNVNIAPIGKDWQQQAAQLPTEQPTTMQGVNAQAPKVKALTSTFDPEQIAWEERENQKINAPAFSNDNLEHLWDVFNSASKSTFAAIGGAMLDQAKQILDLDRYAKYDKDGYDKAISNLDKSYQKTVEWGKSNQPKLAGTVGEDIMSMAPFAALAASSILLKNPTLARSSALAFGEMGWGEGLQAADEWGKQTGRPLDEWQRQSAAVGYMLAYTVPFGKYIDKYATKGLGKAVMSKVLTANPEIMIKAGNEIIEQAAKQSPSLATKLIKTAMSSALHGVGTMEAMDITKMVTDKIVLDKGVSVDEFWTRIGHSAKAGVMFGLATAPFAAYRSVKDNAARRQAQGEVTFAIDENGKAIEILPTKEGTPKGMTPDGKIVDVTQDMLKNSITMTTEHFNEAVKAYKENGSIEGEGFAREAYRRRVDKAVDNISQQSTEKIYSLNKDTKATEQRDHIVEVVQNKDGNVLYVVGENIDGSKIATDIEGRQYTLNPKTITTKVKASELKDSLMSKYDEANRYNPDVEQQQAIAAEKQAAADQLQSLASPDGMIRTVSMMDGTEMQIRGERIVFDPETGRLDRKNSSEMLYYTDTETGEVKVLNPKLVDSILSEKPIEQAAFEADQQINQEISDKQIDEFLPLQPEIYQDTQGTVQVQYNPETMEIEAVLIDEASGTPISEPYAVDKQAYSVMSGKPMPEAIKTTVNEPLNDGITPVVSNDMTESAPEAVIPTTETTPQYPVNKKGEIDFDAMTVAQTYQYMVDNYGQEEADKGLSMQENSIQGLISKNITALRKVNEALYGQLRNAPTIQEQLKIREKNKAAVTKLTDERTALDAQLAEIRALMPQVEQAPAQPEVIAVKGSSVRPEEQFRREQEAKAKEQTQEQPENAPVAETTQPVIEVRSKEKNRNIINPWQKRLNNLGDAQTLEDVVLRRIAADDILESYLGITNFTPEQLDIIQNLQNEYYGTDTTTTETSAVDSAQGIESETATGTTEGISTEQIQSETDLNPTEAQKKAGNYKKAHIAVSGMDISIENPVGSVRRGTDEDGKAWEHEMKSHYGYFLKTEGKDGDHIDTFIKEGIPTDWNGTVFAIDQINPKTGAFDETKVMIGYETPEEAKAAYMENYDADWKGFSAITPVSLEDFKTWLYDGKKQRKPFAEYKETPEAVEIADQSVEINEMIDKPVEATTAPKYKNGDTVYYKGKPYVINGLYNGELMYDLETEDGKEAFEEVPESELNQSEQPLEKVEKPEAPKARPTLSFNNWKWEKASTNAIVIRPNTVGKPFTDEQFNTIMEWGKKNNFTPIRNSRNTRIEFVVDKLDNALIDYLDSVSVKAINDKKAADEKAKKEEAEKAKKEELRKTVNSNPATSWINREFGEDAMNDYNKNALAKFLSGETKKFEGQVNNKWVDAITRLNALTEDGKGVDFDKLKKAYEQAEQQPKQVDVAGVFNSLNKKGEAKLSENIIPDKVSAAQAEADAALQDFLDAFNDLNSDNLGIVDNTAEKQAKMLVAGTKMVGAYTKLGVYKFADLVSKLAEKGIQITEDLLSAIKKSYGAFAAENDIDELDDMKTVRSFKLSDIQPITKEKEQIISTEDNNLPESNVSLLENKQRFINAVVSKLGNEKLNIVALRKIAEESGFAEIKDTTIQEYTELAIIMKAHTIVKQEISQQDKYNQIVELYEAQPTISMRSSERIAKQQYSTPIPLSFLAGEFVNKINPKSVLEPSAGNGMMVFNVDEEIVIANEIDEVRLDNLRDQGFKEVTNQDGTLEFNIEPVDGVITNPPFGKSEARDYEGYKIAGLDEQMVVNALSSMADHGRAAIIIGGHTKYKENGTLASEKAFLNYLYDKYNVVDIINVDGGLYSKQGTTFPVRLILINGRRTGFEALQRKYAPLQKDARSEQVSTFDELYKRVKDNENNLLRSGTSVQPDSGVRTTTTSNGATIPTGTTATNRPGSNGQGESGTTDNRPSQNGRPSDKPTKPTTSNDAGGTNIQPDAASGGQAVGRSTERSERRISTQDADKFLNRGNARPEPLKVDLEKEKTQYPARSKSAQIGSVVPTNVAQTINEILHKFDDIDAYVQIKLGYESKDELYNALAAEQIDSVALAIYQIENGKALIIGDMTGVGKGRQAASIIRYAVMSGKRPIFITEKPQLFSDIYRDLRDIGSADLNPFILNSKGNEDPAMTDENGVVIYNTPKDAVKKQILASGKLPEEYDYAVLTYSQLNGNVEKKGLSEKQSFFRSIAADNILVLDESHNAGGEGNTGTFMTETLPTTKGVVFLSGTFAKRADNMPIYAMKTSMNEANMSETELIEAIKTGGIPLQEIMSKNLTETGQMVRRERDFTGVTIDWQTMTDKKEQHWKTFDGVIELFNELIKFQKDYIDPVIEAMNDDVADVQGTVDTRTGTRELGISNQPFASKTFNLVRQMLFSLKAQEVADEAIKELKAGNKPVIAIGNTMETFINDIGAVGTTTDKHDYSLTLVRGLTGLFRVTETDANGERIQRYIDKSIIGAEGLAKYAELEAKINKLSSGISISPIDVIKAELSKAGYSVGEMTGRTNELVFNEDGTATVSKRTNTDKKKLARDFNSGNIDVLILNQSASTGISLHASNKFKDQRKRVMLFAQNQLDVNTEVQMRGRIDRTGQVQRGAYRYIISPIPAEQRMIMMFKAKLKSLDANTTSSQKSKTNEIEVVDFLNKYGDEIVIEYLKENPDINLKMLDPFNLADKSEDELAKITSEVGAASKAAGRAALLSVKEQEAFYNEITEKYNTLINYLNDAGANDLEITTLPLKAETKAKHIVIQGKNSGNPFSEDSVRETVEVDVLKKPMTIKEVNEEIQKLTEGKTAVEYRDALIAKINDYTEKQVAQETQKIQEEIGKKQESFFAKAEKEADKGKLEGEARNEFMDSKRQDFDAMMQLHIDTRTNAIRNRAQTILRTIKSLPVGKVVLIPSTLEIGTDTTYSEGMFLGFRMKEKLTPSTITAVFATLDGRRRIDVPLSKVPFLQAVYSQTMQNIRHIKATPENWDSMIPTRTRKTAYIITGNILQAYGRNELRGQLVSYSTVTGEIRQGILLPDKYKSDEQSMRVQVIDRINELRNGQALADVSNGVTIRKETPISYSISVPLSKVRGGKYFLDAGLRDLVYQKDFRQMAGQMVGMVSENKIEEALRYLSDKFNISVDVDIKKVDDDAPQFQTLSEEYDNAANAKERYNAAVEMVAEMDAQNGTKTIIARDNEDFISMLPEKYADFVRKNRIGAVLYKGTLIINQVNQVDADAIRVAYEHENAHIANNAVHTREELSELWDNVTESERRLVPKMYSKMDQHVKGDELITYAIEDIIKKQGYENYKNGNVDLSLYSEALQNKLKKTIDYANNKYLANNGRRIQNGSTTDGRTIGRFQQVNGEGTRTGNRGTTNGTDQLAETINIENKLFEPIERLIDTEYIAKRNEAQEEISITEAIGANNVPYPDDLWGEAYKSYTTNAPVFNSRNIYSAIYKEGHRLKRIQSLKPLLNFDREVTWDKLPEKLEEGKNYDNAYKVGAPKINTIRALKFSDEFNYIIDQYAEVLVRAKQLSTPAAQEIINDVLKDIEYAKDYYERYAQGEDVWRTDNIPRFQIIGEQGAVGVSESRQVQPLMQKPPRPEYPVFTNKDNALDRIKKLQAYNEANKQWVKDNYDFMPEGAFRNSFKDQFALLVQDKERYPLLFQREIERMMGWTDKTIPDTMDWYKQHEHLSSKNGHQIDQYNKDLYSPFMVSLARVTAQTGSMSLASDYMIISHAIERNQFNVDKRVNEFEKTEYDKLEKLLAERAWSIERSLTARERYYTKALKDGNVTQEKFDEIIVANDKIRKAYPAKIQKSRVRRSKTIDNNVNEFRNEIQETDYSGAYTILKEYGFKESRQGLQDFVADFESKYQVGDLWQKNKAANDFVLDKLYEGQIITAEVRDELKTRWSKYVPLRGFDEIATADDLFGEAYHGHSKSGYNNPLKTMKGRKSRPEDPFKHILSMAETAILKANKNLVNQTLNNIANFIPENPYVFASKTWYIRESANSEWVEVAEKPEQRYFDEGNVRFDKNKLGFAVFKPYQEKEHDVIVYVNGNKKVITFTDPRVANGINGTSKTVERVRDIINWKVIDLSGTKISKLQPALQPLLAWHKLNTFIKQSFTSYSPNFIIKNGMRDAEQVIYTLSINNPEMLAPFMQYFTPFESITTLKNGVNGKGTLSAIFRYLFLKPDMNFKADQYFQEFLEQGVPTGIGRLKDIQGYEKEFGKQFREAERILRNEGRSEFNKWMRKWMLASPKRFEELIERLNSLVETNTRLAVYIAGRETGKSKLKAGSMAKNYSINFTKSGEIAPLLNLAFLFANPAIQSTKNYYQYAKAHPVKTGISFMGITIAGFALSALAALMAGDDDEGNNYYYMINENVRKTNVIFFFGSKKDDYIKIPLTQFLSVMYGWGVDLTDIVNGKANYVDKIQRVPVDIIQNVSQVNVDLGFHTQQDGRYYVDGAIPQAIKPLYEAYIAGEDAFEMPVSGQNEYNEGIPEYRRSLKSTAKPFVKASEFLNKVSGGDKVQAGAININPDNIEHIVQGYTGTAGKFYLDTYKTAAYIYNQNFGDKTEELKPSNIPIAGVFYGNVGKGTQRTYYSGLYYDMKQEYDKMKSDIREYRKVGEDAKAEKIENSNLYKSIRFIGEIEKEISDLRKVRKNSEKPIEVKQATEEQFELHKKAFRVNKSDELDYYDTKAAYNELVNKVQDYRKQKVLTGKENQQLEEAYGRLYGSFGKMKSIHSYVSAIEKQIKENNENVELTPEEKKQQNAELEAAATELMNQIIQQP